MEEKGETMQISLQELLEAGVHFGHQARRWNPHMKSYIYTTRDGVHIIDLALTAEKLQKACEFLKTVTQEGHSVLFVGTKRQAQPIIKEEASAVNAFYINERWIGGLLTNWDQIGSMIRNFRELKQQKATPEYENLTKKEKAQQDKKIDRSQRFLAGIEELRELPGALVIVDTNKEINAVKEALKKGIPIVAIVDTNSNPDAIDFPIPGNDDAIRSIRLLVNTLAGAVKEGKDLYEKKKAEISAKEIKIKTEEPKKEEVKEKKEEKLKKEKKDKDETKKVKKVKKEKKSAK